MSPDAITQPNGFTTNNSRIIRPLELGLQTTPVAITNIDGNMDFNAIISASQILAGTLDHNELLYNITHLMFHTLGGDYCGLILPAQADEWQVNAIATAQGIELFSTALDNIPNLPIKLIQHIQNTKTAVIINDLKIDSPAIVGQFTENPPKSILCQPLLNQNNVVGIIYLQHQSVSGAFANSSQVALNFLYSQAAISLENARLHKIEQEKSKQIELSEANLRNLYENAADPILLLGENAFVDCNRAAVELFEATYKDQLCALHPAELSPEFQADGQSSFDKAQAMMKQGMENGSHRFEWQHQTICGRIFWTEVVLTPLRYQEQMVLHSIVRDISQRKAADTKILQKSQELEQALSQLKHSQAHVVQAEKMSALGNLVAGVAHEINNPIGFLNGSIKNAQHYVQDLQSQLDLYQEHYPNPAEPIQENAKEIDLDFVFEDLPKLLTSMQGATDRIKSISTSLRTFSRADTEHKVSTDIHKGLDSTLLILKYRLKANEHRPEIIVSKDYGKLLTIDCFPGQLNQVFMNLLANAIDVFDEAADQSTFSELEDKPQHIKVKTAVFPDERIVEIRIGDNGKGISAAVQERIFDHLFTTKGVDKGTGLGLAITRQIIEEAHNGTIEVQSQPGQGTEFCIRLPF